MMKDCLMFARQRLYILCKHPARLIAPVLFLAALWLVGWLFSPRFQELREVKMILIDEDRTAQSALLWERLSDASILRMMNEYEDGDIERAKTALLRGDVNVVYIIREGFAERIGKGRKDELLLVYLNDYNISAKLLSEVVAAETLRLFATEKVLDYLEQTSEALGVPYTDSLRQTDSDRVDAYWADGLTFAPEFVWMDAENAPPPYSPQSLIVTAAVSVFLVALCIAVQLVFLAEERENGILAGIEAIGKSSFLYAAVSALVSVCLFAVLLPFVCKSGAVTMLTFVMWAVFAVQLLVAVCKKRSTVMLVAPLLFVFLTFIAAGCMIYSEQFTLLRIVGLLNPFYCGVHTDVSLAVCGLVAHIVLVVVLLWRKTLWRR